MPLIGEIKKGTEIGKSPRSKFIWHACVRCGKQRWVTLCGNKPRFARCSHCAGTTQKTGPDSPSWKGGRQTTQQGHVLIKLQPDDFFYPMANHSGYIREHRLVVAKALGRCLLPWEIVHHKEGFTKDDNRYPETLQLVSDTRHNQITILENRIQYLEKRVTLLEAENALLKARENVTNL